MCRTRDFGIVIALTMAVAFMGTPLARAATVLIDPFNVDQSVSTSTSNPDASQMFDSNVLGGYQDLFVSAGTYDSATLESGLGSMGVVLGSGTGTFTAYAEYDGGADSSDGSTLDTSGLGIDLSSKDRFSLASIAGGGGDLSITVWNNGAAEGSGVTHTFSIGDAQEFYVPFSDFTGIDFSDVGAIRLNFLSNGVRLDSFAAVVPLPSALGLGLLGLSIIGMVRHCRKQGSVSIA